MEVTKYTPVNKGNLLGFASCRFNLPSLGMFYINSIGVCQKNGQRWVNMPNKPYETPDGIKKYQNFCGFEERDCHTRLQDAFFKAFDEYMAQNKREFGAAQGQSKESFKDEGVPF